MEQEFDCRHEQLIRPDSALPLCGTHQKPNELLPPKAAELACSMPRYWMLQLPPERPSPSGAARTRAVCSSIWPQVGASHQRQGATLGWPRGTVVSCQTGGCIPASRSRTRRSSSGGSAPRLQGGSPWESPAAGPAGAAEQPAPTLRAAEMHRLRRRQVHQASSLLYTICRPISRLGSGGRTGLRMAACLCAHHPPGLGAGRLQVAARLAAGTAAGAAGAAVHLHGHSLPRAGAAAAALCQAAVAEQDAAHLLLEGLREGGVRLGLHPGGGRAEAGRSRLQVGWRIA